ncbi:MAG TPA: TetR/AcrR family transcriptional regulator [Spirochaetota bacterium]|nr:TetR/AcrR family transcriptional regulator [Spirochaetota bacterium]
MNKLRARSEGEKAERRVRLLESAKGHFSMHGYQATTIRMITGDADLTPGSFYQYFDSKLEIYRTLSLMGMDILEGMIARTLEGVFTTASDRIRALAGAYYRFFATEREYYDIIAVNHLGVREFFSDLKMVPLIEKRTKALLSLIASIIDEGVRSGEFRSVDSWKTAVTLWGVIDGVLILEVKKSTGFVGVPLADLVAHAVDMALAGMESGRRKER